MKQVQMVMPAVNMVVHDGEDENNQPIRILAITEQHPPGFPGDQTTILIPMPVDVAKNVGKKLMAPKIDIAPASAIIKP